MATSMIMVMKMPREEETTILRRRAPSADKNVSHNRTDSVKPKEDTIRPKEDTIRPKEDTIRPKEDTIRPKEDTIRPKEDTIRPKEDTIRPKEDTIRPKDESIGPKDEAIRTKDEPSDLKKRSSDIKMRSSDLKLRPSDLASKMRPSELKMRPSDLKMRSSDIKMSPSDLKRTPPNLTPGLPDLKKNPSSQHRIKLVLWSPMTTMSLAELDDKLPSVADQMEKRKSELKRESSHEARSGNVNRHSRIISDNQALGIFYYNRRSQVFETQDLDELDRKIKEADSKRGNISKQSSMEKAHSPMPQSPLLVKPARASGSTSLTTRWCPMSLKRRSQRCQKAPEHKATASVPATGPSLAPTPAPPPSIAAPVVDTVQAAEGTMVAKEEEEEEVEGGGGGGGGGGRRR